MTVSYYNRSLPGETEYAILVPMQKNTEINVKKIAENQVLMFQVTISQENSQTQHMVSLNRTDYVRLTKGHIPSERLVKEAFTFLLEKEPKEKILKQFDFTTISRYFPNFLEEIEKRIDAINN